MRGVKGTGPNGVKDDELRIYLKAVTLHETFTWPGVPKMADNTVSAAKVPGLKMYLANDILGHEWLYMECGEHSCEINPINIRVRFEE